MQYDPITKLKIEVGKELTVEINDKTFGNFMLTDFKFDPYSLAGIEVTLRGVLVNE